MSFKVFVNYSIVNTKYLILFYWILFYKTILKYVSNANSNLIFEIDFSFIFLKKITEITLEILLCYCTEQLLTVELLRFQFGSKNWPA